MQLTTPTKLIFCFAILIFSYFHAEDVKAGEKVSDYKDVTAIVKSLAPGYKTAYSKTNTRSIDLNIEFKINSAKLSKASSQQLNALGNALNDRRFTNSKIIVAGHTDASGSANFNKRLSHERAKAVAHYLQKNFEISSDKLSIVGFGATRLKNILQPKAPINRRVEIMVEDGDTAQQKPGKIKW